MRTRPLTFGLVVAAALAVVLAMEPGALAPGDRAAWQVARVRAQPPAGGGPGPGIAPVRAGTGVQTQGRPAPVPHNPRSFLPVGADGIFVLEVARLRGHPSGPQLDNAIANFPDWRALVPRNSHTPAGSLERLIITQAADGSFRRAIFGTHRPAPAPRIWDVPPGSATTQSPSATRMGRGGSPVAGRSRPATSMAGAGRPGAGMMRRPGTQMASPKPPRPGVSMSPASSVNPAGVINWRPVRATGNRGGTWTLPRSGEVREVFRAGDDFSVAHPGLSTTTWRELLRVSQSNGIRNAFVLPPNEVGFFEAIGVSQIAPELPWRVIIRIRPSAAQWQVDVELIYDTSARADVGVPFLEARRQRATGLAMVHLLGLSSVLRNMRFTKTDNIVRTSLTLTSNQLHVLLSFGGRAFR